MRLPNAGGLEDRAGIPHEHLLDLSVTMCSCIKIGPSSAVGIGPVAGATVVAMASSPQL